MFTIDILLFAGLRERAQTNSVTVTLPANASAADIKPAVAKALPELAPMLEPCRIAIAQTFAAPHDPVPSGSEVALIPPVSGGHDGPATNATRATGRASVGTAPLVLDEVVGQVSHPGAGGLVIFSGQVRAWSRGERIVRLDYEAYEPMATKVLREIISAIEQRYDGSRLAIAHRLGELKVGQTAVVIAASAPHRAEAFAACRDAIEALKRDAPIWKREHSASGAIWIGQGP